MHKFIITEETVRKLEGVEVSDHFLEVLPLIIQCFKFNEIEVDVETKQLLAEVVTKLENYKGYSTYNRALANIMTTKDVKYTLRLYQEVLNGEN
jgi:hypothetical protein